MLEVDLPPPTSTTACFTFSGNGALSSRAPEPGQGVVHVLAKVKVGCSLVVLAHSERYAIGHFCCLYMVRLGSALSCFKLNR